MSITELHPDGEIVSLHDRRRRRHLLGLLAQRATFSALTVERQSHDRPDAHDHAQWLAAIEQAIEDGWPQVFADCLPDWVRDEAALLHTPDQHHPDCTICVPRGRVSSPETGLHTAA
jgi:hypothetical protein